MKFFGKELKFNGNKVYHAGDKPTPSEIGAAAASHGTHVTWATATPKANGTAAVGTVARVAREDHVHPLQTTVSGNAGTATKLQTGRTLTIGSTGKSFDGSANVSWSLNEIGAATGKTASATTAATAQWYRIATSPAGMNRCIGNFTIEATVSGKHSVTNLIAGVNYGVNPTIQQIAHSDYSAPGITKARIVYHTTYNNNYAYLEVYQPTATATQINVSAVNLVGWTLVAPNTVGSIPSGYTSKEITFVNNKIVANIQGSVSGSAGSATKATQDSAGQQINTTYIKGLSVSGRTITYTKGDGTTGTITTQDTNTTYSTGTSSALGLTKLYTGTGTATDGTMTQKAITEQLNKTAKIMDGNTSNMYTWSGEYIANNYLMYSDTAAAAKKIKDYHDNGDITISYMDADVSTASWFAAWDGRKIKTISASNLRSAINAADYYRIKPEGDNRGVNTTPNTYSNEFSFKGLKQGSTIGLTNATYSYLFGLRGWAESSGGKSHELAFNDNGIWTRRGATTSWEGWQKIITSHDAYFETRATFGGEMIKKASGVRTCAINLYANPDRLEFFWSGTAGGEDWTWSNKSYISADGQIYAAKQLSAAGHRITPYSDNGVSIIRPDGAQFSGLEVKELWIGPYSGASKKLSMSASAPSGPGVGDVWIQNN